MLLVWFTFLATHRLRSGHAKRCARSYRIAEPCAQKEKRMNCTQFTQHMAEKNKTYELQFIIQKECHPENIVIHSLFRFARRILGLAYAP